MSEDGAAPGNSADEAVMPDAPPSHVDDQGASAPETAVARDGTARSPPPLHPPSLLVVPCASGSAVITAEILDAARAAAVAQASLPAALPGRFGGSHSAKRPQRTRLLQARAEAWGPIYLLVRVHC